MKLPWNSGFAPNTNRLGWQFAVRILYFSSIVTLIATTVQLGFEYLHDVDGIRSQLSQIRTSYSASLANSMWGVSTVDVQLQLDGILRLPDVIEAHVEDANGLIVAQGGRSEADDTELLDFPLIYKEGGEQHTVGRAHVTATLKGAHQRLRDKIVVILFSQAIKTFLVSAFILILFQVTVGRYLVRIAQYSDTLFSGHDEVTLKLDDRGTKKNDELDHVIQALDGMRDRLNKAFADLQAGEERFRRLAALSSDWFWEQDCDERFTYFSSGITDFCGIAASDMVGKRRSELASFRYSDQALRQLRDAIINRLPFHDVPLTVVASDGQLRYGTTSGEPIFDTQGHFMGFRGVGRDVTLQTRAQIEITELNRQLELRVSERTRQLAEATRSAESANRAKSLFLTNISHEIRTPLNAILGYAQLLARDERLAPALRSSVAPIEKAGLHLLELINTILDLSKIEAGAMQLDTVNFDLQQLIQELTTLFELRCRQRGILWDCQLNFAQPCRLEGDPSKLRQVLINLLGNAVKFTEQGRISLVAHEISPGRFSFIVEDTGAGIEASALQDIFEPFRQAEAGARKGGTGLGLSISARQVELMGGRIQVQSTPGLGTRFEFTLDLERVHARVDEDKLHGESLHLLPHRQFTALVVDDNDDNREVLARMLQSTGMTVLTAVNGHIALDILARETVQAVFMDIHLPGIDGIETMQRWRSTLTPPYPPCIAVTASAFLHERESYRRAGFDDFIAKPFLFKTLCACLRRHFPTCFQSSGTGHHPAAVDVTSPRIDDDAYLKLMQALEQGWMTGITRMLAELAQRDPSWAEFNQRVEPLMANYDVEGLRQELEKLHVPR